MLLIGYNCRGKIFLLFAFVLFPLDMFGREKLDAYFKIIDRETRIPAHDDKTKFPLE